jgi:hypothetical protein
MWTKVECRALGFVRLKSNIAAVGLILWDGTQCPWPPTSPDINPFYCCAELLYGRDWKSCREVTQCPWPPISPDLNHLTIARNCFRDGTRVIIRSEIDCISTTTKTTVMNTSVVCLCIVHEVQGRQIERGLVSETMFSIVFRAVMFSNVRLYTRYIANCQIMKHACTDIL